MRPEHIAELITEDIKTNNGLYLIEEKSQEIFIHAIADVVHGYEPGTMMSLRQAFKKAYGEVLRGEIGEDEYHKIQHQYNMTKNDVEIEGGIDNYVFIEIKDLHITALPGKFEYEKYVDFKHGIGYKGEIKYPFIWDDIHKSIENGWIKMKNEIARRSISEEPKSISLLDIGDESDNEPY